MTGSAAGLSVRAISVAEHLDFIRSRRSASFLQTPAWGEVKNEWRHESIGWYDASDGLVGVGLVLYRQLPRVKRYLAYLPEGPVIDWDSEDLAGWLAPMTRHLRGQHAFGVRMGPPVVLRRWSADAVKQGVADDGVHRLGDVPPTARTEHGARVVSQLRELGWAAQNVDGGFAAGQPPFNFQIPLKNESGEGRSEDEILKAMNQQWRRNIKKADKAGVVVNQGSAEDLPAFHALYAETAVRDGFTPRPLAYFERMLTALQAEDPDRIRLYLAHHEDDLVAATTWVRVGTHTWYSYGASSTAKRDVRGSNAIQWQMIRDAIAAAADTYDLRGITDTLDMNDPHVGLLQFKVGTGGVAVEYVGEWDLPLNRLLYKAFDLYMSRR